MPIINLKQIFHFDRFRTGNNSINPITGDNPGNEEKNINQRIEEIYGQDQIKLQLLYEKWVIKDDWKLRDEALLLLFAIDPDKKSYLSDIEQKRIYGELWSHATDCVEQGLLKVLNREQTPEEWRVRPVDVYRWSKICRIETPEALDRLMEFVINTVKSDISSLEKDNHRDNVLGMALAIMASCPEQCKNDEGRITAENILKIIDEKRHLWPGDGKQDVSLSEYVDLINKWLNSIPKV